jgi:hypothetical protein
MISAYPIDVIDDGLVSFCIADTVQLVVHEIVHESLICPRMVERRSKVDIAVQ